MFPCIVTMYLCSVAGPPTDTTGIILLFSIFCHSVSLFSILLIIPLCFSSQVKIIVVVARLGLHCMLFALVLNFKGGGGGVGSQG